MGTTHMEETIMLLGPMVILSIPLVQTPIHLPITLLKTPVAQGQRAVLRKSIYFALWVINPQES